MSVLRRSLGPCDIDLDRLVYGELTADAEAQAREHLARCEVCRREHEMLLLERRAFVARAWLSEPAPLPDVEQLLARAATAPLPRWERASFGVRWQTALRRWSSPWRGAVLQSVLGAFAVGLILQVSHSRKQVASRAPAGARPVASTVVPSARPSADNGQPVEPRTSPLGPRTNAESCDDFGEVCVDQPWVSTMTSMAVAPDPCVSGPQSQPAFVSADWSTQKSSFDEVDSYVEAVCAPDAI